MPLTTDASTGLQQHCPLACDCYPYTRFELLLSPAVGACTYGYAHAPRERKRFTFHPQVSLEAPGISGLSVP
jgi:hypothetical protein